MTTLIVFVIVFGGMIFLHEFGHFIVSRIFNIPVEEFGFGIPPRAWRFWRNKGHLTIGGKKVVIPSNYDLPFHWQDGLSEEANATVDEVNGQWVLRSIELVRAERMLVHSIPEVQDELALKSEFQPESGAQSSAPAKAGAQGGIALSGVLSDIEPGMEWTINWLPLGGFVRPRGENDPTVPGGLAAANPWKRIAVLVAGPLMNLLTAVVVLAIIIAQGGVPVPGKVRITEVTKNSPAELAGIQQDDVIALINGKSIEGPEEMITVIRSNLDKPVELSIDRGNQQISITVTPLSSRPPSQGALGVGVDYVTKPASPSDVVVGSFAQTGTLAYGLVSLPVGLLTQRISPDQARLVGLKGIYDFFGVAIQRDTESRAVVTPPITQPNNNDQGTNTPAPSQRPTNAVLGLIAMLSVSLGVFNLMPIPALDGGRILFALPEILFRRRIPTNLENTVNGVAFLLLIGLMLFVNVMDFISPANLP